MRTRSAISLTVLVSALALGGPAFAFDPPRPPGSIRGNAEIEANAPRPPGTVPTGRTYAPAAVPNGIVTNAPLPRPSALPPIPAPQTVAPAAMPVTPSLGPAVPIDPPNVPAFAAPSAPITPFEAFRSGTNLLREGGDPERALSSLEYAAERGLLIAQFKLARMYADGEGVQQSDVRAFQYYSRIADGHSDEMPGTQQARIAASAFVALANYYRDGIPNSRIAIDNARARELYHHAAVYFGDADAQYFYGRMLYDGIGGPPEARRAAPWLYSAANKGHAKAQAVLGRMLFKGEPGVPRQAAYGLMWLTLARSNAGPADAWIAEMYDAAFKQATTDERAAAGEFMMQWINRR